MWGAGWLFSAFATLPGDPDNVPKKFLKIRDKRPLKG